MPKPKPGRAGQPVTLGIRPEDIGSAAAEQLPNPQHIPAQVDVVEHMGAESYIYFRQADTVFISRVDAHRHFRPGENARLAVYLDKCHFFDAQSGQVLC